MNECRYLFSFVGYYYYCYYYFMRLGIIPVQYAPAEENLRLHPNVTLYAAADLNGIMTAASSDRCKQQQ